MSQNDKKSRFYLSVPAFAPDELEPTKHALEQITASLDIACVTLTLFKGNMQNPSEADRQQAQLVADLQKKGIAVLADISDEMFHENRKNFEKMLEKAGSMEVDGIHIDADKPLYSRAREVLGDHTIIGADCGLSKHQAMQLGELGADYVAFRFTPQTEQMLEHSSDQSNLVTWWQDLFEVPCVASDVIDQEHIETLLQIPADFIGIGPNHWSKFSSNNALLSWLSQKCPPLVEVS